jgi:hypothetical protein
LCLTGALGTGKHRKHKEKTLTNGHDIRDLLINYFRFIPFPAWGKIRQFSITPFIRIQVRKRLMNPKFEASDRGSFVTYNRNSLCDIQKTNNDELGKILQKNSSTTFFVDHSISFLNSHCPSSPRSNDKGYASTDEFREKFPLTTYDDYRNYIDRIVIGGEKSLLSSDPIIYFCTSSGTTAKPKLIPMTKAMLRNVTPIVGKVSSAMWRCLPSSLFPSPEQRQFFLQSGKKQKCLSDLRMVYQLALLVNSRQVFHCILQ